MLEYIERDKVLAKEFFFGEHATWDNPMADGCMAVRSDFIMNIPAADVVPVVHGYWIVSEDSLMASCSHCNMAFPGWRIWPANYCPNCGAKMDGDKNV